MKNTKKLIAHGICLVLGLILVALGIAGIVDAFWSGVGGAWIAVGVIRLVQCYRLQKDEAYREKVEIELTDERNRFLRSRAWAWAGYLFIMVAAVASIVCRALGLDQQSMAAGLAVCILVLLYWISYLVLRKKY